MAEKLPGRPCADIKNMYHSLMRSGKIVKSDRPRPVDRTRSRGHQQPLVGQQHRQRPEPSQFSTAPVDGTKKRKATTHPTNDRASSPASGEQLHSSTSQEERPKTKYRPSGIPLVAAPPFASPNTTNAARVLMSLDVTSNSTWPGATSNVTTDSSMDKHPIYDCCTSSPCDNNGCTVASALPCTTSMDDDHAGSLLMNDFNNSTENVVCKVYIHKAENHNNANATAGPPPPQLLGFATLPSTHLTFAQARTVLQTELALAPQNQWSFTVPGQGRLTLDQESKLHVDFLVTPDALGTVSAPLPVIIVTNHCSDAAQDETTTNEE